ncbi:MAG: hypothetical protein AVDCRST_MAG18-5238, partial [uncultured Thermomicrobiales bacterium]
CRLTAAGRATPAKRTAAPGRCQQSPSRCSSEIVRATMGADWRQAKWVGWRANIRAPRGVFTC